MNEKVKTLLNRPQLKQLSPEWFAARPHLITASSASSLLIRDSKTCDSYIKEYELEDIFDKNSKCCNPYSSKNQYFLDRCRGSSFKGSAATFWGQKYEQVASDIYSNLNKTEVLEFGLLVHPELDWIGASPDGITPAGVMLEIKCPYRRKITGIPPFYYWQQCQIQLEVCDLEICDFAEYEFVEFETEEEWLDDETITQPVKFKGLFLTLLSKEHGTQDYSPGNDKHIYPPKELLGDVEALIEWESQQDENCIITYWKIFNYSITRIPRDKKWFEAILPDFKKEWKLLEFYKKNNNYKHLIKQKPETSQKTLSLVSKCVLSEED
jgi:putative phage-type endonuclease